ncbi:Piwi domain-containing protein [Pisolithus sp. B1]|nr:Piwi domain-containing protein [Pisolithus sp. B1]
MSTRLSVHTNAFKIERITENKKYYQYDGIVSIDYHLVIHTQDTCPVALGVCASLQFQFESEVKQAGRRIEIFERLQNHTEPTLFTPKVIYDGDADRILLRHAGFWAIPHGKYSFRLHISAFEVNMSDRGPSKRRLAVTLKRVDASTIDFNELRQFLDGRLKQQTPKVIVAINLLQLIVRQGPNLKYPNNIRSFFTKDAGKVALGGGLEAWKGFYQSVRPTHNQLLINVDVTCGVLYQEGRLIDVALALLGQSHVRALRLSESSPDFRRLKSFFKGRRRYKQFIPDAGHYQFQKASDGPQISVQEYYRETYNIHLQYPDIIGVGFTSKGQVTVIPAELCVVLPNQRYVRKVPQECTKKMVEFSSEKPQARMEAILRGLSGSGPNTALDYKSSPYVQEAGLQISATPSMIDGQVLKTPGMAYGQSNNLVFPRNGGWNVLNQKFHQPRSISAWAVVDYSLNKARARSNTERFVKMLVDCCGQLGMSISLTQVYKVGSQNVAQDLLNAGKEASQQNPPDLILVVLPSSAAEIRLAVKQFGDVHTGISTQCVREDKIARANNQYCNNVAMKINAKLGGVNAVPRSSVLDKLRESPFMIMGVDVGHPAPGAVDQPSVASLVFSFDVDATRYEALTCIQRPRLEIIEDLGSMVKNAVSLFGNRNKTPPQRLVLFRDGLSEGEYAQAATKEIQAIKDALDALWKERSVNRPKPLLTYIVVGKKHHVRFFPKSQNEADKSGNCPAGFVADKGIGNPMAQDFYLQSHGGLLGTSRPSHYIILEDENFGRRLDILQNLSFCLCHSYARATRSVSIPAPVYYADIVCARANFHFDPRLHYDDSAMSSVSGWP